MSKCTACGDKPENTAKDFTKAVIEINNPETLVLLRKVVIPASMGDDTDVVPAVGKYHNVILQYEANGHIYLYSSDGIPTAIESNVPQEVLDQIAELEDDVDSLERADEELQREIDELKNSPDVVDIVATYADLQEYDTSTLGDKDVIRVLEDETHNNESAYYRWDKTNSQWVFIGAVEGYYTKDQTDDLLDAKQDLLTPGENIAITDESGDLVISAVDTTYTAGYGLELEGTEFSVNPDIVQDALTAGDNISIDDESGSLVISAVDTTYSAGSGLNLAGTTFSVDTTTIATQADLDAKQDVLTAGDNITIEDESGALVISATDTRYTAGTNVNISSGNVISATDTTYSNFVGTDGTSAGTAGLVPAPATADAGKFLKADGTWDTAGGGGPTVVQAPGSSTTDVMSQNATTKLVFNDINTRQKVFIGAGSATNSPTVVIGYHSKTGGSHTVAVGSGAEAMKHYTVAIGNESSASESGAVAIGGRPSGSGATPTTTASGGYGIALGFGAQQTQVGAVAIGHDASASASGAIALGYGASATQAGEVNIGSSNTSYGYSSTNYRLITGVHDPQSAHDAATKGYVDTAVDAKQDILTAGQNITIVEESGALVISATGGGADAFTTNEWNALWA